MYKLKTVDVWDTILRRDCHPECIKLATAHYLLYGWHEQIKGEHQDGWMLYKTRLEAEKILAIKSKDAGKDDEYQIVEVIKRWCNSVFTNYVPANIVKQLIDFELRVEVQRSYVDSNIVSFLEEHKAEKTIFLSDFYMNSEMLKKILSTKELTGIIKEGVSSCDIGLNKRSGNLFRHIHRTCSVLPSEHVHIGDNEWSDIKVPQSIGIKSIHYQPIQEQRKRIFQEQLFISRKSLHKHIQRECLRHIKDNYKKLSSKEVAAMCIGANSSALFVGFALWTAEQTVLRRLERIYFFTREGEFFHKLYSSLFQDNTLFGHNLPPAEVLAVSRLSTFSASLRSISIKEMLRIWSLFKVQSISGLFKTLNLDQKRFEELLSSLGLKYSDIIRDPQNDPKLARLFASSSFIEAAEKASSKSKSLLKSYLESKKIFSAKRVGIVDIGWRGTIQDNIALIAPDTHFHGMYLGLRPFINQQPTNTSKESFGPNENISQKPSKLFENFSSMEMLCNSQLGSVVGYKTEDDNIFPDRLINEKENMSHEAFTRPFQEGVLIASQIWAKYIHSHVISSNEIKSNSLDAWESLRKNPSNQFTHTYLSSPQIDVFGYGDIFERNKFPSLSTILLSPISSSRRNKLIDFVRRVQWSAAITQAEELGLAHKSLLLGIFYLANISKRTLLRIRLVKNKYKQ